MHDEIQLDLVKKKSLGLVRNYKTELAGLILIDSSITGDSKQRLSR